MSLTAEQFVVSLDGRVNDIIDACTKCGACAFVVEVGFVNLSARRGSTRGLCLLWLEELLTVEKIWKVGGLKGKKHFKK